MLKLKDFKAFIEYWNNMDGIYKNIEEYNPNKKIKILIVLKENCNRFHIIIYQLLTLKAL